jgi:Xaa-Pro aminopeptidase
MQSHLSPAFFAGNRIALRRRVDMDIPVVITANGVMQRSGDEPEMFHQESNFWYLTGINSPELVLVMLANRTFIIVPGMTAVREAFDGAHDLAGYAKHSGITEFLPEREGWRVLKDYLRTANSAATLTSPPAYIKNYALHTLPYHRRLIEKMKRLHPGIKIRDIRSVLSSLRSIKQPVELQAIQRAIDITCSTLEDIASGSLAHVTHEYEIEAELSYGFRKKAAHGHAFTPVVGAGAHSTTLHHMENNGPIRSDDLIVLDVGAEVEHYAADIARTISQTPMTGRKADVFKAVVAAQDYAISLIRPGVMPREYERAIEAFIGDQLVKLDVFNESDKTKDNIRQFFPHATSHFLGLDTHDDGDYEAAWQEGMVITCEPGIYLPEENIGVRIEDDILITRKGCEVLSKACPRALTPVQ